MKGNAAFLIIVLGGVLALADPGVLNGQLSDAQARSLLDEHNGWRREYDPGLAPLAWDCDAAASAQEWADRMAQKKKLTHDPAELGKPRLERAIDLGLAENLAVGSPPSAGQWYAEKAYFMKVEKKGKKCEFGAAGVDYNNCGHYANMVGDFHKLGCGARDPYLVCRYGWGEARPCGSQAPRANRSEVGGERVTRFRLWNQTGEPLEVQWHDGSAQPSPAHGNPVAPGASWGFWDDGGAASSSDWFGVYVEGELLCNFQPAQGREVELAGATARQECDLKRR